MDLICCFDCVVFVVFVIIDWLGLLLIEVYCEVRIVILILIFVFIEVGLCKYRCMWMKRWVCKSDNWYREFIMRIYVLNVILWKFKSMVVFLKLFWIVCCMDLLIVKSLYVCLVCVFLVYLCIVVFMFFIFLNISVV